MCSESIRLDFKEHNGTSAVPEINNKILTTQSAYLSVSFSVVNSLQLHRLQRLRLLCPWDFPGKNTGVGCHFLLHGIFLNQGSSLYFQHWQADSFPLNQSTIPIYNLPQSPIKKILLNCFIFAVKCKQIASHFKKSYHRNIKSKINRKKEIRGR